MRIRAQPKKHYLKMQPVWPEKVWKSERNTYTNIYHCITDTLRLYRLAPEEPEERQRCQQQRNDASASRPAHRVSRKVYSTWNHSVLCLSELLRDVWGIPRIRRKWNGYQDETGDWRIAYQEKRVIMNRSQSWSIAEDEALQVFSSAFPVQVNILPFETI